jgi:hypothetical protein
LNLTRSADLLNACWARAPSAIMVELRGEKRGSTIVKDAPPAERGRPGAGTAHHVA